KQLPLVTKHQDFGSFGVIIDSDFGVRDIGEGVDRLVYFFLEIDNDQFRLGKLCKRRKFGGYMRQRINLLDERSRYFFEPFFQFRIVFVKRAAQLLYAKDRKSTRLNSSHVKISYAVFCL